MSDLNSWDIVNIMRVDRIQFRSGPPGSPISPHGNWVIVGFVGAEALIAKDGTIVKVPISDIKRVGVFTKPDDVMKALKDIDSQKSTIDMVDIICKELGWDEVKAKKFLIRFNLPLQAMNEQHSQRIVERVTKLDIGGYDG